MHDNTSNPVSYWSIVDNLPVHAYVPESQHIDGIPIVLVHGVIVSTRYLLPTLRAIAPWAPVYAPDLPGFGKSAKPPQVLSVPLLSAALGHWMDGVALTRAVLVGNSFGCQIVAHLVARRPELAARVVLTGPTVDPAARPFPRLAARWLLDVARERPTLITVALRDLTDIRPRRAIEALRAMMADRIEDNLPLIGVPTLVVLGEHDTVAPSRWGDEIARTLPNGELRVLPGAPHSVVYSAAEPLAQMIHDWCGSSD